MSVDRPFRGAQVGAGGRPVQARPIYKLVVVVVATVVAVVLYFWLGRNDPLPVWVSPPPGSKVLVSRHKPVAERQVGAVVGNAREAQYYLQVSSKSEPREALLQWMPCLSGFTWEKATPRQTSIGDSIQRASWPEWVRKSSHRASDVKAGFALSSSSPPTTLYLYAWPIDGGSIVELVAEDEASAGNEAGGGS